MVITGLFLSVQAFAYIPKARELKFREFEIQDGSLVRFVDPDNGNICYLYRDGWNGASVGGISCVNKLK